MRIDLPSGGWADVKEWDQVRGVKRAIRGVQDSDMRLGERANAAHTALMAKIVTAWELPYLPGAPLPSEDPAVVDDLDDDDNDALEKHLEQVWERIQGKPVTPDDVDDPASPTAPANA